MATTFVRFSEVGHQCMLLLQWQNKVRAENKASLEEMREVAQSSEASLKEAIKELETVLSKSTERQALTWANLICSIVESSAVLSSLAIDFCVALTQSAEQALLRLQILQAIYSALHSSQNERYQLFCVIVEFATKTKNAHVVVNSFPKVNSWLLTGGLWASVGSEGRRRVHTLMYHALLSLPGSELTAYQTLVEVLGTYSAADIQSGIAIELAVEAATLAIRLPEVHQCDELLALDAITHLSTNPSHATLHQLLSLFTSDSVKGYLSFHEQNAEFLTKTGLSHEQCLKKIRLLTLTSVAAQSHLLTYKAIAEHLAVPVDDVEFWIVSAISNHLLDAKMDQIQQTVTINQTNQRVFSTQQWRKLSERLHLWRNNVAGCAAAFEEAASASSSRGSAF